jgi:phosphoglucosamine mutase
LDICRDWQPFPQKMINVRLKGQDWQQASAAALAEAESELSGRGRVVLRPSGTEPVVRVMVEADELGLAERCAKRIAGAIEAAA